MHLNPIRSRLHHLRANAHRTLNGRWHFRRAVGLRSHTVLGLVATHSLQHRAAFRDACRFASDEVDYVLDLNAWVPGEANLERAFRHTWLRPSIRARRGAMLKRSSV